MPGSRGRFTVTPSWLAVLAGHVGDVRQALGSLTPGRELAQVAGVLPGSALARASAGLAEDLDQRLRALAGELELGALALGAAAAAYGDADDALGRSFRDAR